jgi:hypothetical protein
VAFQHLVAGCGNLGTVLLQAGKNGEITLIDHRSAKTRHVAGAGFLLLGRSAALLLGEGIRRKRDRQQEESQENFTHRIPSFRQQKILFPNCVSAWPGRIFVGLQTPRTAATKKEQALVNAAKFAANATSRITI